MRRLATVRKIDRVEEIPGADNICLVHIDGWQCVAKKDEFREGNLCIYFEIDSILPDKPCFDFMRARKFRVRTIKCMKQLSQGLALPLSILNDFNLNPNSYQSYDAIGTDLSDALGIEKYDPEAANERHIRTPFNKVLSWYQKLLMKIPYLGKWLFKKKGMTDYPSHIVAKTDEERYQNASYGMKENFINEFFDVTEKIDGTSTTFIYRPANGIFRSFKKDEFMVCSRNFRKYKEDNSWWWCIARLIDAEDKMAIMHRFLKLRSNQYLVWQGETIGPDIQKNKYKVNNYDFFLFNLKVVDEDGSTKEYAPHEIIDIVNLTVNDIKTVPLLAKDVLINTVELLDAYIKNPPHGIKSVVNKNMIAEGNVYRLQNQNVSKFRSFKYIHPAFLLKNEE